MSKVVQDHISAADVPLESFRTHIRAWHALRAPDGGVPHRHAIDPFLVPELADCAVLFEATTDGRMIYRLMGQQLRRPLPRNPVGLEPYDLVGRGPYGDLVVGQLLDSVEARLPVFSHHRFQLMGEPVMRQAQRLSLPLTDGERISRVLCYQVVFEASEITEGSFTGARDWEIETLAFVSTFE